MTGLLKFERLWRFAGEKARRRPRLALVVGGHGRCRPGLAPFGEGFPDRFREGLGGGGCVALSLPEKERGLVDEDSDEPAFEGALAGESGRVAGGGEAAVFDRFFGFLSAVEDAVCDEEKQPAAAGEPQFEGGPWSCAGVPVGIPAGFAG